MFTPLALALLALAALAAPSRAEDENIEVKVVAVLATGENTKVDTRLKVLAPEVAKTHPHLTGFAVETQAKKSMKIGETASFPLVDNVEVTVTLKARDEKTGCVTVLVKPPTLGEIKYSCCCGKYMPFITRHETKDKKQLVVAVMVQPCKKKDAAQPDKPKNCGCASDGP